MKLPKPIEALKEQLANLPAAKQTGNFTQQVAIGVNALFKCIDANKLGMLATDQDHQAKHQSKVRESNYLNLDRFCHVSLYTSFCRNKLS